MSMELQTAIELIESCRNEAGEAETDLEDELEAWQFLVDRGQVPERWLNTADGLIEAGVLRGPQARM
eukprot:COSAG02_NODE_12614_length_1519_cov_1.082394_2_plen_67_part_00